MLNCCAWCFPCVFGMLSFQVECRSPVDVNATKLIFFHHWYKKTNCGQYSYKLHPHSNFSAILTIMNHFIIYWLIRSTYIWHLKKPFHFCDRWTLVAGISLTWNCVGTVCIVVNALDPETHMVWIQSLVLPSSQGSLSLLYLWVGDMKSNCSVCWLTGRLVMRELFQSLYCGIL